MDTRLYCANAQGDQVRRFRTAVSLHSHTECSQEPLEFLPRLGTRYAALNPLLRACARRHRELHGREFDFARAWWTPPLNARESLEVELGQIEKFGFSGAMVSLTDHDTIAGGLQVSAIAPVSVEWTVPFGPTFFHFGVHNLGSNCETTMSEMQEWRRDPRPARLRELLRALNEDPKCLMILNHPLWDERGMGATDHRELIVEFIRGHREFLHALEINGLRSPEENAEVLKLAEAFGLPVVAGGDRHGCEPNAVLNVTNAYGFAEFVTEVRVAKRSDVVFMPQYRHSRRRRFADMTWHVLREYPEHPEHRQHWTNRVFYRCEDGRVQSLHDWWEARPPAMLEAVVSGMRALNRQPLHYGLRLALGRS